VERHLGLVETLLPPEPISLDDDEEIRRSLPDLLAGLRQELEAIVVLLINDDGRILARAGDLPDSSAEVSLLSSLLSIYSASQKVSYHLGQKSHSSWHIFDSGKHDLIYAPVGATYAMLAIGKKLADEGRLRKTIDIFSASRDYIHKELGEAAAKPRTKKAPKEAATAPPETVEKSAKELEPLFKDAKKKLKPAEVDEFWDKAAGKHKALTKPDMLSYDQAKQLGLAPEDES
jgi:hypothetical protein